MRALFGLVGVLVAAGVFVWWMSSGGAQHLQNVARVKKSAGEQASQFAGKDTETGAPASESATLDLILAGGKPDSVLVVKVLNGGAYERYFGLKDEDTIVQIGPLPVKGHPSITSNEDAAAFLMDAYQKKQPIVVVRDGKQITLPVAPPAGSAPPGGGQGSGTDPLQQQIDSIGGRRGL